MMDVTFVIRLQKDRDFLPASEPSFWGKPSAHFLVTPWRGLCGEGLLSLAIGQGGSEALLVPT